MSQELLAILLIIVVHVIGAAILIWAMLGEDGRTWYRSRPDDDSGWQGPGPPAPPAPPGPRPGPDGLPLPLPDAAQSAMRLRGPERAGDWRRRRRPMPSHPPTPRPRRTPSRRDSG